MPAMWPSSVRSALAMGYAILFTIFTCNAGSVLAAVRQAPSSEPFYVAPNGVTVMCPGVAVGDTFTLNDVTFTKVDSATLTSLANDKGSWPQLATSCTTGVTTMANLFYRKKSFNEDISSWDTSSVKTLFKLFWGAEAFNQPIGDWDTSSVKAMSRMFFKAYAFNQPIGDWDTSSVTNMERMFRKAKNFNQDLTGWQVGQMTKKSQCKKFCKKSGLGKNNAPGLPKKCRKGCK